MKVMSKQTAVEWLVKQLLANGLLRLTKDEHSVYKELKDQAKAMEKEQIINSHIAGMEFIAVDPKHYVHDANNYYNSEYKGGDNAKSDH